MRTTTFTRLHHWLRLLLLTTAHWPSRSFQHLFPAAGPPAPASAAHTPTQATTPNSAHHQPNHRTSAHRTHAEPTGPDPPPTGKRTHLSAAAGVAGTAGARPMAVATRQQGSGRQAEQRQAGVRAAAGGKGSGPTAWPGTSNGLA